jgi:hypothetical protein
LENGEMSSVSDMSVTVQDLKNIFPNQKLDNVSDQILYPIFNGCLQSFADAQFLNGGNWRIKKTIKKKQKLALLAWKGEPVVLRIQYDNLLKNHPGHKPLWAAKRTAIYNFERGVELSVKDEICACEALVIANFREFIASKSWPQLISIGSDFFNGCQTNFVPKKILRFYGIKD